MTEPENRQPVTSEFAGKPHNGAERRHSSTFPPLGTRPCAHSKTVTVPFGSGYRTFCSWCEEIIEEVTRGD